MAGFGHQPSARDERDFYVRTLGGGFDGATGGGRMSQWNKYRVMIMNDRDSSRVAILIAMLVCYDLAQLIQGLLTVNTGLVTASFHTLFDCIALCTSLAAMVISRKQPDFAFSYGYDRFEVLAGFTNAIFLVFVAVFGIMEAFHGIYKTDDHHRESYFALAVLGLAIDLVAVFMFRSHTRLRQDYERVVAGQSLGGGHDYNIHGVFLHVIADLLGNSSFILSAWAVEWYGFTLAPALSSFAVSIAIIILVKPLLQVTGGVLLQTTPLHKKAGIEKYIREISTHEGVLECRGEHWWSQTPGVTVGSLHIRIRADTNEQTILCYVHTILKKYMTHLTVQIEKDTAWLST